MATAAVACLALVAACSSGSASGSSSNGPSDSSSSAALAPFKAALQVGYKGTSVAPPTSSPAPKKGVTAWIISCGQSAPGCSDVVAGAVAAGQVLGWKTKVYDGQFGAGGAYDTGIRQAIAAHASVIIPIGIDCNVAKTAYQAAKAANIPIVSINSYDCNDPALKDGPPLFSGQLEYNKGHQTTSEEMNYLGQLQADWLVVHSNGKAKIIEFTLSAVTGLAKEQQGFNAEIAKCSGCTVLTKVAVAPPDESNGVAGQTFSSLLTKYPQATAVWTPDDSLIDAAQIPQAIASAGRLQSLLVLGVQGFAQNLALIRDNKGQSVAVAYDPARLGWGGMDEANRILNGMPSVPEGNGLQVIDATHNMPPAGQNWKDPINYEAAYKKAWGQG